MPLHKLSVKDIRPDRILKKLYQIAKFCKRYHSPLTFKYYLSLIYYLRLRRREGFQRDEIFSLGLLSSSLSDENSKKYISDREFKKITDKLNPMLTRPRIGVDMSTWPIVGNDKGIFYTFCKSLNLPIPQLYAIFFRDFWSVSYITNSPLIKRENIVEFIKNELPNEFVIKPSLGFGGEYINIYTKTKNGIIDGFGNLKAEQEIYQNIINNNKYSSFIVQERLRNHPDLFKIHPAENPHVVRIVTLIDSSGQCKILHWHLYIANEENIETHQGNLRIKISLNDGSLEYGILRDKSKGGFKKITEHPETGQNLKEFKLPFWKEVLSLAEVAAFKFLPLRTLGWDIAITEKGLMLLETNIGYSPPNYFNHIDKIIKDLSSSQ